MEKGSAVYNKQTVNKTSERILKLLDKKLKNRKSSFQVTLIIITLLFTCVLGHFAEPGEKVVGFQTAPAERPLTPGLFYGYSSPKSTPAG